MSKTDSTGRAAATDRSSRRPGARPSSDAGADRLAAKALDDMRVGRLAEAQAACRAALAADPDHAPALHLLGVLLRQAGQPDRALEPLRRAVAVAPGRAPYEQDLADTHRQLGDLEAAAAAYARALAIDPRLAPALNGLGITRMRQGDVGAGADLFRRGLKAAPGNPQLLSNLGNALLADGDVDGATECYRRAIEGNAGYAPAYANLGSALLAEGQVDDAIAACRAALAIQPDHVGGRYTLATALTMQGDRRAASAEFLAVLDREPQHPGAMHMLRAVDGGPPPPTAPPDYVRALFDQQAAGFEAHVRQRLRYRVPEHLRRVVDTVTDGRSLRIVDLGCGTGLCGVQFERVAARLTGIDLSPNMVRLAERLGIYDEVILDDVVACLRARRWQADLLLAGDLMIYVGDLADLFEAGRAALKDGGLLAFSTERAGGDGFVLRPSGRFAHADAYIERLAAENGFALRAAEPIDVRIESGVPIPGMIFVLGTA